MPPWAGFQSLVGVEMFGGVVGVGLGRVRRESGDEADQLWVSQGGEPLACRAAGGDRSQALLRVAAVFLDMQGDQRLDYAALVGVESAAIDEMVGHALPLTRIQA